LNIVKFTIGDSTIPKKITEETLKEEIRQGHDHVYVICSHSDDHILGPGATLAKFAKEGAKITTIILSFGELTPAWLNDMYTAKMRVAEAKKADKIIGGHEVLFFGVKEGRFEKDVEERKIYLRLQEMIERDQPSIIFTHLKQDPQPDHRATLRIVKQVVSKIAKKKRPDVYSFNIWNPLDFKSSESPKLIVDVSDTFHKKMKALMEFKSQRLVILQLIPGVWLGGKFNGFSNNCKFAEVFTRVHIDS
jgi:LmbE family N-acetylglucosaminyl deacetylase